MLHVPVGSNTFGLTTPSTTARPAAAQGTSVTPAIGSKGAWAQVFASSGSFDTYGVLINFNSNSGSNASRNTMTDIGIGTAGNELVLIPDLISAACGTYAVGANQWYYFPIFIPAGTRIAARSQGSVATAHRVYIQLLQAPMNPSQIRKGSFVEAIGTGTVPTGTSVTAGTTTEGAWTSLGTTTNKLWWWQVGVQVSTADTSWNAQVAHMDLAYGDATDKIIIISELAFYTTTAEVLGNPPLTAGVEVPVPAGSEIWTRIQSSGTVDPYLVSAYGLGG